MFARVILRDSLNRVLMTIRTECNGCLWNFPGGKVHIGEAPQVAAARELYEEAGLVVHPTKLILVSDGEYELDGMVWRGFYFKSPPVEGTPENKEPDIHSQVGYFDIASVQANGSKKFVLNALAQLNNSIGKL